MPSSRATVYGLSNRQRKELYVRRAELRLALPAPLDDVDPDDLLDWARGRLPDVDAEDVREVEEMEIAVRMPPRGDGLTGVLGAILPDDHEPEADRIHVLVVAVVVTVRQAGREPRHQHPAIQWPAKACCAGRVYG